MHIDMREYKRGFQRGRFPAREIAKARERARARERERERARERESESENGVGWKAGMEVPGCMHDLSCRWHRTEFR